MVKQWPGAGARLACDRIWVAEPGGHLLEPPATEQNSIRGTESARQDDVASKARTSATRLSGPFQMDLETEKRALL